MTQDEEARLEAEFRCAYRWAVEQGLVLPEDEDELVRVLLKVRHENERRPTSGGRPDVTGEDRGGTG